MVESLLSYGNMFGKCLANKRLSGMVVLLHGHIIDIELVQASSFKCYSRSEYLSIEGI